MKVSNHEPLADTKVKSHAFYRTLVSFSENCNSLIGIKRVYLTYVDLYLVLKKSRSDLYSIIFRRNRPLYQSFWGKTILKTSYLPLCVTSFLILRYQYWLAKILGVANGLKAMHDVEIVLDWILPVKIKYQLRLNCLLSSLLE